MDRIGDTCIYIGDRYAAESLQRCNESGITHIITVDNAPLKWIKEKGEFKYLCYQCFDMVSEDLLTHFPDFFQFIDEAANMEEGKVLIHCFAGMSRSVTVAAGYLMFRNKISLEAAIQLIKKYRGNVKPNPGFWQQLELFEQMGCDFSDDNPIYRKYKLEVMAQDVQSGNMEVKASDLATDVGASRTESFYKCMKCRRPLFRSSGILEHTVGQGEAAFDWRSKIPANKRIVVDSSENQSETVCDRSLFIEPVQWMAQSINQLDGKLMCPKCQLKLGSFIWYGEKCPCGAWVAPAFHIQSSKVDLVQPHPPVVLSQSQTSSKTVSDQSQTSHMTSVGNTDQSGMSDYIQTEFRGLSIEVPIKP